MKIIVTGFEPFGGEKINPAMEILKSLKDRKNEIEGKIEIHTLKVPTVFGKSIEEVIKAIDEVNPDFVLMVGQAGGRAGITIERVAINISDAGIKDNVGQMPIDEPIDKDGPAAYFSTLPVKEIVSELKKNGIPSYVSNTAGTYVCNHIMYGVLNYINKNSLNIKAGFMHIPYLPIQVIDKANVPSMNLDTMIEAVLKTIEVLTFK